MTQLWLASTNSALSGGTKQLDQGTTSTAFTVSNTIGTSTGWLQIAPDGSGTITASEPSTLPNYKGWSLDTTLFETKSITGNWDFHLWMSTSVGSVVGDVWVRYYQLSNVTGASPSYASVLTEFSAAGVTISTTAAYVVNNANFVFPTFGIGDKILIEIFVNVTTNSTGSSSATINIVHGNSFSWVGAGTNPSPNQSNIWRSGQLSELSADMNWTTKTFGGGTTIVNGSPPSPKTGDFMVVIVGWQNGQTISSFSDNMNHAWTRAPESVGATVDVTAFWTTIQQSTGPLTFTITKPSTSATGQMFVMQLAYSGFSGFTPNKLVNFIQTTSTAITMNPATINQIPLMAAIAGGNGTANSCDVGFSGTSGQGFASPGDRGPSPWASGKIVEGINNPTTGFTVTAVVTNTGSQFQNLGMLFDYVAPTLNESIVVSAHRN